MSEGVATALDMRNEQLTGSSRLSVPAADRHRRTGHESATSQEIVRGTLAGIRLDYAVAGDRPRNPRAPLLTADIKRHRYWRPCGCRTYVVLRFLSKEIFFGHVCDSLPQRKDWGMLLCAREVTLHDGVAESGSCSVPFATFCCVECGSLPT